MSHSDHLDFCTNCKKYLRLSQFSAIRVFVEFWLSEYNAELQAKGIWEEQRISMLELRRRDLLKVVMKFEKNKKEMKYL